MDEASRDRRVAELRVLQCSDPRRLIDKYREITDEPASNQLPHGVSFSRMIDTIVDFELTAKKSLTATNSRQRQVLGLTTLGALDKRAP